MPAKRTRMNGGRGSALGAVVVEVQAGRGELNQGDRSVPNYNGV